MKAKKSDKYLHPLRKLLKILGFFSLLIFALVLFVLVFFRLKASNRERLSSVEAAPSSGKFVPAGDINLFIQEAGPSDGRTVLLMHGTGSWSEIWRETIDPLAEKGFHIIAVDLPPFGYSDKPVGPVLYSRENQAQRIIGLLDSLQLSKVILVGHSAGARSTLETALRAPDRVEHLILVDPAIGFQTDENTTPHFVQNEPSALINSFFALKPVRNTAVAVTATNPLFTKKLFLSFVSKKEAVTRERVRMIQQPLVIKNTTQAYGDWLEAFVTFSDNSQGSNFDNYKKLSMPVSIIWGSTDEVTPLWQGKQLQKLIPTSELFVIDDVGHIPYIEDVKGFNELLFSILSEQGRTSSE